VIVLTDSSRLSPRSTHLHRRSSLARRARVNTIPDAASTTQQPIRDEPSGVNFLRFDTEVTSLANRMPLTHSGGAACFGRITERRFSARFSPRMRINGYLRTAGVNCDIIVRFPDADFLTERDISAIWGHFH